MGRPEIHLSKLLVTVLLFSQSLLAFSQDTAGRTVESEHSTLFGVGSGSVYDSYLSPYSYSGTELRVIRETMRETRLMDGRVSYHTMVDAHASLLENRPGNVNEYAGGVRYSNAWLYDLRELSVGVRGLSLFVGPAVSGYLGGVYNERNGNNPAQLKTDVMIDAKVMARYDFTLWRCDMRVTYQMNVPLLGCAFSPNYGQSYYELFSLGNYDGNVVFANVFNSPSWRHLLTVEIPTVVGNVRVGYCGEFMQAKFNNLGYHSYSHNFMLGWVKNFGLRKRK